MTALREELSAAGAVPRFVGSMLGAVDGGEPIEVDVPVDAMPSVLFDAVIVGGGTAGTALATDGRMVEFVRDQYRHCKTILALPGSDAVLQAAGIAPTAQDPGVLVGDDVATGDLPARFMEALARHRHFERESTPPPV